MTYEGLRLRVNKLFRLKFAKKRNKKIRNKDFTIISNNCWGGMIYESYNMSKLSPTVGLFFMASDYIKFVSDLKHYIDSKLRFIDPQKSKHVKTLSADSRFGQYPIAMLDDIEIMFLHAHSEEEAKSKWERRCTRINWDKLIIKFNDQNGCMIEDVVAFSKLPYKNKLFFTIKNWPVDKWDGYIKINQHTKDDYVTASHEPYGKNRYIDLEEYINNL